MSKKRLDFKRMLDDTDFSDPSSIERYAANLDGMTFRDILELGIAPEGESAPKDFGSKKYKGGMGTLIEERYFGYKANSDDRPDFPEAGVELKATCFDVLKNGRKSAGERLVLTMIPYDRPVSIDYDSSHLKTKLSNILLIYYGRDRSIDKYDQRIERAVMVRLPEEDMKIIRADYEKIISYIQDGRADELSEGMTTYLGACTKGATEATMWADQYYEYFNTDTGEIERHRAKRRAFSLKRSYMDYVLHTYVLGAPRVGESIVQDDGKSIDFESYVTGLIERHYGETDRQIAEQYGLEYTGNKAQWTTLVYRMLGIKNNAAEEFVKAGISVRTVTDNDFASIQQFRESGDLDYQQLVQSNQIVAVNGVEGISKGDTVEFTFGDGTQKTYTVGGVLDGDLYSNTAIYGGWFLMPAELITENSASFDVSIRLIVKANNTGLEHTIISLEKLVDMSDGLTLTTMQEAIASKEATIRQVGISIIGVTLFLLLFSIITFASTIITNIATKKREYAMLQSIGMTWKQTGKMALCESCVLAVGSLILTLILGIILGQILIKGLISAGIFYLSYTFPLTLFTVYCIVVVLIILTITISAFYSLQKTPLVERLRIVD